MRLPQEDTITRLGSSAVVLTYLAETEGPITAHCTQIGGGYVEDHFCETHLSEEMVKKQFQGFS